MDNKTINKTIIENIKKEYDEIFYKLIRLDRSRVLYIFLESYNDLIKRLKIDQRPYQEILIDEYKEIFLRVINFEAYDNFRITLYQFEELLLSLDKENSISVGLLDTIFILIEKSGKYVITNKTSNVAISYIAFVDSLMKKMHCIYKDGMWKQRILDVIFSISVEAIELKNNEIIRNCSNTIGWISKEALDRGDYSIFCYSLDIATILYKLVSDFGFEDDVLIFIGTLFIIIGAYACSRKKSPELNYIEKKINEFENKQFLVKSKNIRYYQARYWDDTFEGNAEKFINDFYERIQK